MRESNLTGRKFGKLTVIRLAGQDIHQNKEWLCQCSCNGPRSLVVMKGYAMMQRKYPECPDCTKDRSRQPRSRETEHKTKLNLIDRYIRGYCGKAG